MFGGRVDAKGVVVGRIRGDEVQVLRVHRVSGSGPLHVSAGAQFPWSSGESLGEPLERLLRWRADEKVILTLATPSLAGGTVSPDRLVAHPKEDQRSRLLHARWEARERVLESAARFFQCTIESVSIMAEETHPPIGGNDSPLSTVVAVQDRDGEGVKVTAPPPDVPDVQFALLPLFLGPALGNTEDGALLGHPHGSRSDLAGTPEEAGLLVLEEEQLSYSVWSGGLLRMLRTLPLGGDVLVTCLTRSLQCSPREAERLLTHAECGQLSSAAMRIVSRVLKTLLPLYTGAWAVFGKELGDVKLPTRLVVVGLWPAVFSKLFCRPPFVLRLSDVAATPHVLPRPDLVTLRPARGYSERRRGVHGEGGSSVFLASSPAGRLLEHLADLAAPRMMTDTLESLSVVRHPVRSHVSRAASRVLDSRRIA